MMLVTGATGNTGGATLKAVQKLGAPVRVLVRDPSRFQASDGVEVATGSFEDAASLDAALDGVDHAYLVDAPTSKQVEHRAAFGG